MAMEKKIPDFDPKKELKPNTWEVFARCFALEGKTQYESYCTAYPNQINSTRNTLDANASRLLARSKIKARVNYLRSSLTKQTIKGFAKTRDDILNELEALRKIAEETNNLKEQRENLKEQAKLLGYYEDNLNVKGDISLVHGLTAFKNRKDNTNN